jgi:hypothetical protein
VTQALENLHIRDDGQKVSTRNAKSDDSEH